MGIHTKNMSTSPHPIAEPVNKLKKPVKGTMTIPYPHVFFSFFKKVRGYLNSNYLNPIRKSM